MAKLPYSTTLPFEDLLVKGYQQYCVLVDELKTLVEHRNTTITNLQNIAASLDRHCKRANISKLVGSGVAIGGGIAAVTGLALIPVSAGASAIVAGLGGGVAAVGGLAAAGTSVTEFLITEAKRKSMQKIINQDAAQCAKVKALWPKFEAVCDQIGEEIEVEFKTRPTKWYHKLWRSRSKAESPTDKLRKLLKERWESFNERAEKFTASMTWKRLMFLVDVFSSMKHAGMSVFEPYSCISTAILRGLEECAKPAGIMLLIATLLGRAAAVISAFTFAAIGLILDIVTFIKAAYKLAKGSHSATADEIRKVVAKLEAEQECFNSIIQMQDEP